MTLSKLDQKYIFDLEGLKELSHDPLRRVAVIIAGQNGEFIANGTNHPPKRLGFDVKKSHQEIEVSSDWKYHMFEHAERNAIFSALNKGLSLKGSTMYGTLFPCSDCARAISSVGTARLVVPQPGFRDERDEKWKNHYLYALEILKLSNIKIDFYTPEDFLSDYNDKKTK